MYLFDKLNISPLEFPHYGKYELPCVFLLHTIRISSLRNHNQGSEKWLRTHRKGTVFPLTTLHFEG